MLGRLAATVNIGDGGSSDVWDLECETVLDGLRAALDDVVHDDGTDLERAAAVAAGADIAVVVVGYTYLDEGEYIGETDASLPAMFPSADEPHVVDLFDEKIADLPPFTKPPRLTERTRGFAMGGDRTTLRLPPADVELIRAVAAANPRTVVVVQAGSAVVATEWIDAVPAVVQAWYGGCRAGSGLADVLLGTVNPSARLPFVVPVDEADLPAVRPERGPIPLRPLARLVAPGAGPGRSRPSRSGSASRTRPSRSPASTPRPASDAVTVRGTVRNTGPRDGADVVQIYAELPDAGRAAASRRVHARRSAPPAKTHRSR